MRKRKKSNKIKRAITHIKLDLANSGKLDKLKDVAKVYMTLVQAYVTYIFDNDTRDVNKYDKIPTIATELSERYKRCAWQQAVGIMHSFFSNRHKNKPVLKNILIQGNSNLIKIELSSTNTFDYWLRIATLEKRKPVRIPIKIHQYGKNVLETGKLCSGVTLKFENDQWYATFVVEANQQKEKAHGDHIGVDIGIRNLLTTTRGHFGHFSKKLIDLVDKDYEKRRRKQKLNACLKNKGRELVSLQSKKVEATIRNEIGRAINQFINTLPKGPIIILEKLSVADMRFKSRRMNRILKASKIGYICDRLREKLDLNHIEHASVTAAYSSQECSKCGYVDRANRPSQEKFVCRFCEHRENADVNASETLPKRFGDEELQSVTDYRKVKLILLKRFFDRFPDARSVSGELELGLTLREIGKQLPTVNQLALT